MLHCCYLWHGRRVSRGRGPPNFGVKLAAGWCPARRPSRLLHRQPHGVAAAANRDSVLRTSFAAAVAPRCSWRVKPAAAYTKDVSQTADAERNKREMQRELCVPRENHLFVGVAGVLRSTSPQPG